MNLRRGRALSFLPALVALALLVGGGVVAVRLAFPGRQRTIDRSGPVILQALADLSSYRAATGTFQVNIDEEQDITWAPAFLAGERTVPVDADHAVAEPWFRAGRRHVRRIRLLTNQWLL